MRGARAAAAVLLAATLTAGACGGEEGSAARRSATRWATAVCSDLGRWIDVAASGAPPAAAEAALALRARIARVEPPDTEDGLAAQGEMEKLATAIEQRARHGNAAEIDRTVSETRVAIDGIRGLTPGGAVEDALAEADPCRRLRR